MAMSGYVKIEAIKGESKRADHTDEIDVHSISWTVAQRSSASVGSGRTRGRAEIGDVTVRKFTDASSPDLAFAAMKGTSHPEIVIMARKDSGEAHLDYLQITLSNCAVSNFKLLETPAGTQEQLIEEEVSFTAEHIKIKYILQADDHSAGKEFEKEYDIVAGK